MAQLGDTGNGQFVHVVAYYSEFHRTHRAGLFVVVVAVPIIVIKVITHAGISLGVGLRVVAGLIQGKASRCGRFTEIVEDALLVGLPFCGDQFLIKGVG